MDQNFGIEQMQNFVRLLASPLEENQRLALELNSEYRFLDVRKDPPPDLMPTVLSRSDYQEAYRKLDKLLRRMNAYGPFSPYGLGSVYVVLHNARICYEGDSVAIDENGMPALFLPDKRHLLPDNH